MSNRAFDNHLCMAPRTRLNPNIAVPSSAIVLFHRSNTTTELGLQLLQARDRAVSSVNTNLYLISYFSRLGLSLVANALAQQQPLSATRCQSRVTFSKTVGLASMRHSIAGNQYWIVRHHAWSIWTFGPDASSLPTIVSSAYRDMNFD